MDNRKKFEVRTPPNFYTVDCCGTCVYWVWSFESDGDCKKYRQNSFANLEYSEEIPGSSMVLNIHGKYEWIGNFWEGNSFGKCDDWKPAMLGDK